MSAYTKALRLLGETERMLASEREREQRLHQIHSDAETKAVADLVAGGASESEKGFNLRVADKVWSATNAIQRCQANIKRLEERALTLREVINGEMN